MIKQKNIFGIAILLILIINLGFILAQETGISEDILSFDSEKVDYTISEDGKEIKLEFTDGGFVEINEIRFENVLPADKSFNPSYIRVDEFGNILEADLTANEKGSSFLINGLTFEAPPNSRVYYDKNGGFYLENIGVFGASPEWVQHGEKDKFVEQTISGENVNFFDELFLNAGTVALKENEYLVEGDFVYDNIEIILTGLNKILIEKNPLKDLSNYNENFIQHTNNGLKIQSREDAQGFGLRFLEGNEIFDIPVQEGNKEHLLSMDISGGDGLEITKKDYLLKGMPPLIKHSSSEQGTTIIKNGRHIFKFENGEYLNKLGNLNAKNKFSVNLNLDSDILEDKSINVDEDNGYVIYEPKTGENLFTFNKALLDKPNYNFKSEIGEKIYSYAENQIGASAFVSEGRGQCYGTETEKFPGFDCIGLGISSLKNAYPKEPLKNFPPNLKLVETLEKKGWKSSVIEPSNIVGEETAKNSIKNIPPGSIVFLMHEYSLENIYPEDIEGISYKKYLNSNGDEVFLNLGHTLIRGTGEKNFINAKPAIKDFELPLRAKKINENLIKQGKERIFGGVVREGEMIPENDFLIVISPPED